MDEAELNSRYMIVEKLVKLFKFERFVHLIVTSVSLIILIGAISAMIIYDQAGTAELSLMFGSSGLITYTGGRLLKMWDQALTVIVKGTL
jgi:hypothetical protein